MSDPSDTPTEIRRVLDLARRTGLVDQRTYGLGVTRLGSEDPPTDPTRVLADCGLSSEQIETLKATVLRAARQGADAAPGLPARLGKYRIVGELGVGGMGVVYKAVDEDLRRTVALKVLRYEDVGPDDTTPRFQVEAQALAKVRCPYIIDVYDAGRIEGRYFLALEFVEGGSLAGVDASSLSLTRKLQICRDVARALEHAHGHGLMHRDVKPSNILLRKDGSAVLTDFGLARDESTDVRLTASFAILGTPAYMSPEQAEGDTRRTDFRTDIYSLGVVLYELLSGSLPFHGQTLKEIRAWLTQEDPVPLRGRVLGLPADVEAVAMKALERRPENRYPSARAFADDLDRLLTGDVTHARPRGRAWWLWSGLRRRRGRVVAVGALLVLLGAAGGLVVLPRGPGAEDRAARARVRIDEALALRTPPLAAAAKSLDVPRVQEALEVFAEESSAYSIEQVRDDVRTQLATAGTGHVDLLVVADLEGRPLVIEGPEEAGEALCRSLDPRAAAGAWVAVSGAEPWLLCSKEIRFPGPREEHGGWGVAGQIVRAEWWGDALDANRAAFAWRGPDGALVPGGGLSPQEAEEVGRAVSEKRGTVEMRGQTWRVVPEHGTRPWTRVVVAHDPWQRELLGRSLLAVASLGGVLLVLAGLAAAGRGPR